MSTPASHRVETATATGEVLDQGALVLRWAPRGAEPVLFAADGLVVAPGRSPHSGVPVCWPWFGPGRRPGMEPMHGFVRGAPWTLVSGGSDPSGAELVHEITSDEATSPHWPHPYRLRLRSRLGDALELALTTTNTGDHRVDVEEVLHAYLAVGDVARVRLEGLDDVSWFDKVRRAERHHRGDLTFDGETDGVFRTAGPVTVVDPVLRRRLVVTTSGARNVVVWNPWAEKAAEISDIAPDDWTRFVCVEGGNVLDHAVVLEPGESHTLTYRVEVEAL